MSETIKYEIKYAKIKNVYLQIKEGIVIVKAPRRVSKKEIDKIIKEKANWIEKNIGRVKKNEEKQNLYAMDQFKKIVEENFKELIEKTGLIPNKIRIRDIKYAWGTCSKNKNITISEKLIKYSKNSIRYVIIHELCHLKEMNHSKNFWILLEKYMPNYKEVKKEFK